MTPAAWVPLLTGWLAGTDLANLELDGPDGLRLRLTRTPRGGAAGGTVVCHAQTSGPSGVPAATAVALSGGLPAPAASADRPVADAGLTLRAGAAGVLRLSHPLHTAPLAAPGQTVVAGQALALLQLGSLLLPVCAPCAATVQAWCADEGQPVEWGQPLLRLMPRPVDSAAPSAPSSSPATVAGATGAPTA